jgi:uncharacterized protein
MSELLLKLQKKGLIKPPRYVVGSAQYVAINGSIAYGCNEFAKSDFDIYGFCIPPKEIVFPHLAGVVRGFGHQGEVFEQWQEHHVKTETKEYDLQIYNIVKYFHLCMNGNPNMIDSLFVPYDCVMHSTDIGNKVRQQRHLFLSKKCYHTFKGYAYSQMGKINTKNPVGDRRAIIEEFGWDIKFGYHLVRLSNECEQILAEGDIDLRRDKEQYKSIRRGEWTKEQAIEYFTRKEPLLEKLYNDCKLPDKPRESEIRTLLLECLEEFYGSLKDCVIEPDKYRNILAQVKQLVNQSGV